MTLKTFGLISYFSQNSIHILLWGSSCLKVFLSFKKNPTKHFGKVKKTKFFSSFLQKGSGVKTSLSSVNLLGFSSREDFDSWLVSSRRNLH